MQHITLKALIARIDPVDKSLPRPVFDLTFVKQNGEVVEAKQVSCTSTSFRNDTVTIKFPDSGEIRTIHASLIVSAFGVDVML